MGLVGFALTMAAHSSLLFAASLVLFGAGFFDLNLPEIPENRWIRFVSSAVEWEKNWVAAPWNWYKIRRFIICLFITGITLWALWTRDLAVLALIVAFGYLLHVRRDNIDGGIDP